MDFYDDEPYMIRRSRGYAPLPYMLSAWETGVGEGAGTGILAIGGELKNTFCIGTGSLFYPSSYIGDLADLVEGLGLGSSDIRLKDDFKEALDRSYSDLPEGSRDELMKVAMTVKGHRGISVDELCSRLGWNFSKVSRTVTTLECDGFISVDLLQHCHPLAAKL